MRKDYTNTYVVMFKAPHVNNSLVKCTDTHNALIVHQRKT